jgi:ureidoglycolate lyase
MTTMTPAGKTTQTIRIKAQPMTAESFAPYGRVLGDARQGLDMTEGQFTARVMTVKRVPETLDRINRHMDHSQLFIPLNGDRVVVVVAPPDVPMEGFDASKIAAFVTDGNQQFIFHTGTWHIEPRALAKDECTVINVQTDIFRNHTELLHLEDDCGVEVKLEV